MKIRLIMIGKTDVKEIETLVEHYKKRLNHYVNFEIIVFPKSKQKIPRNMVLEESTRIMSVISSGDLPIILDEKGEEYDSVSFSQFLEKKMMQGCQRVVFIIGGSFGFSEKIKRDIKTHLSLSKMTFPHQLVRLFFIEQLYRAFTILKGQKYHH